MVLTVTVTAVEVSVPAALIFAREKEQVASAGSGAQLRLIVPLKPVEFETLIGAEPVLPGDLINTADCAGEMDT